MEMLQVVPVPEFQKSFLVQMARDFRAALSYVSFYSTDSPFVVQAIQKLLKEFQRLQQSADPIVIHVRHSQLFVNDTELSDLEELTKLFQDKNLLGVRIEKGITAPELASWLRQITLPVEDPAAKEEFAHIYPVSTDSFVTVLADASQETATATEGALPAPAPFSLEALSAAAPPPVIPGVAPMSAVAEIPSHVNDTLLSFVAEAWQFSQLQKKALGGAPEAANLNQSFTKLFDRLLDRTEKNSPEFKDIYQWFRTPSGELLESRSVTAMYPLLEVAVKNGWTSVLFDPSTEGLVNDCLTYWGANGQHELVAKTVTCLAEGLNAEPSERALALTHLMDARPWVRNPELLEKVLDHLNSQLANETTPSLYQSGLLLAWDLMATAIEFGKEPPVLTLLSTLHFHADEDLPSFPERVHIARHWLFERSTPDLIRRFVYCAHRASQLHHFPLLGEMAAPLLMEDFFLATAPEKAFYLQLFGEIAGPIRSSLTEWLADISDEGEMRMLLPIIRVCGMDAALSLQVCSWIAKGSRELKINLISLIEEINVPLGGPALRLAVFDDSEEIAALAARVIGKIHFTPGIPVLLKAAKIREERFEKNEAFLTAVCRALGDLGQPEALTFLQDIARKKPLFRGKNFPLAVRLEAIEALTKINKPEVWSFLGTLMEEKNPALQETLDRIIHEKIQTLS